MTNRMNDTDRMTLNLTLMRDFSNAILAQMTDETDENREILEGFFSNDGGIDFEEPEMDEDSPEYRLLMNLMEMGIALLDD